MRAELLIIRGLQVMQNERPDQDLAAHIVVALGFRETGLEGGTLRIKFSQALFDGFPCHDYSFRLQSHRNCRC
ncbi:hypothetical protein AGR6A_Lc190003 [Agrobacterium sp. NCPPB 925]|nr:hypothetical protein AGR6A_Lc190003 [Agrobacterium sp. NCPPB 925]